MDVVVVGAGLSGLSTTSGVLAPMLTYLTWSTLIVLAPPR
jgi:monoamine oxidase